MYHPTLGVAGSAGRSVSFGILKANVLIAAVVRLITSWILDVLSNSTLIPVLRDTAGSVPVPSIV